MSLTTIYLSGPIQSSSNPQRWRNDIIDATTYDDVEFINPLDYPRYHDPEGKIEQAVSLVERADAVLVHYEPNTDHLRMVAEMQAAQDQDKPAVVWTDRYDGLVENIDPIIREHTTEFQQFGRPAVNRILKLV